MPNRMQVQIVRQEVHPLDIVLEIPTEIVWVDWGTILVAEDQVIWIIIAICFRFFFLSFLPFPQHALDFHREGECPYRCPGLRALPQDDLPVFNHENLADVQDIPPEIHRIPREP